MIKHSDDLKTKFSGQTGVPTASNDNAKADDFFSLSVWRRINRPHSERNKPYARHNNTTSFMP